MAKTIDDVWDELQDIKTALNDLNQLQPIKSKIDELLAKENILVECIACRPNGLIPRPVYHAEDQYGPDIEWIPCPVCGGDHVVSFSKLSATT